jgi:UMP-CMP kinase
MPSRNNTLLCAAAAGTALLSYYLYSRYSSKSSKQAKKTVVFVLGGPGAGKGTQCDLIIKDFPEFKFFSAGDLLRAERASGSSLAGIINAKIDNGQMVPASITVDLLSNAMASCPPGSKFLIDGFPRNMDNVTVWDERIGEACDVKFCLFLDCPEEVMINRILERSKTSGRTDDNIDILRKRFKAYENETMPIVNDFKTRGALRRVVADRPVEVVYDEVKAIMKTA